MNLNAKKMRCHLTQMYGDAFWSPSYFLATAGNVSIDTLHNYINNQRLE